MLSRVEANNQYRLVIAKAEESGSESVRMVLRRLCQEDLFFLLVYGLNRNDVDCDWLYARCREVQRSPDGMLDLWAREHYKSTIITFGQTIRDILNDPEVTVGIFSHTKPIAKDFLQQIKYELETNVRLQELFPDILFENPKKEAAVWSIDKGICVKRNTNPKESTVEAHGLVDGQPTGKHFSLLIYDDVVTRESVTTPEQIKKVTDAWALSLNLGAHGGRCRYIGTRYHFNDTYKTILEREAAIPRIHAATEDGTAAGKPVFLTRESLNEKRRTQGSYVFACQMLQNPKAEGAQCFFREQVNFYKHIPNIKELNVYITVDPANDKKKKSDYTAAWVIGLGRDFNYYVIDFLREKLSLPERAKMLFNLHKKYHPLGIAYEEYGMMADIQHIKYVQEKENYRFGITKVGGKVGKNERIRGLLPVFESGRFYFPEKLTRTENGRTIDLVETFISEEFEAFPLGAHDDMLDSLARILEDDLDVKFPGNQGYSDTDLIYNIDCSVC